MLEFPRGRAFAEALLPFRYKPECKGLWQAWAQRPFNPRGLLIWGVEAGDEVTHVIISGTAQLLASWGPLPARWFAMGDSYEQIAKMMEAGKEPPKWGTWTTVEPAMSVQLQLANPHDPARELGPPAVEVVMWGHAMVID